MLLDLFFFHPCQINNLRKFENGSLSYYYDKQIDCLLVRDVFGTKVALKLYAEHYSRHLNTGLVWFSNGLKVSGCQMVQFLNVHLKTGQICPKTGQVCPVFEWSA